MTIKLSTAALDKPVDKAAPARRNASRLQASVRDDQNFTVPCPLRCRTQQLTY
jgi:hypothetical protein